MKIDLWHESYIDLNQPQHIAALRNLINALMKSVGERGEFRIELGGAPHYGTYTVTKPREMVEVRVTAPKNTSKRSVAVVGAEKASAKQPCIIGRQKRLAGRLDSRRRDGRAE